MTAAFPEGFTWSLSTKRYRDAASGRFIKESTLIRGRDEFVNAQVDRVNNLTRSMLDGNLTVTKWEQEMADRLRTAHLAEFAAGRGGIAQMTDADKQAARKIVREQRQFLRSFAEDVKSGSLSQGRIEARARMYARASTQSFERGRARAWDIRLPAYPADGSSDCLSNDRCHWQYEDKPDAVLAYWTIQAGESCATCVDRSTRWNPYRVEKA